MYAVVGCSDCTALWIVEGRPETTECRRCGSRHRFEKLKQFVTTDDEDHAREVRASMLAARQDESDAFADLDSFSEMEAAVDDADYLAASGVDPDAVADAGDRASRGSTASSGGRRETVTAAIRDVDDPTERAVVEYAAERGVDADAARRVLAKLVRAGDATETDGRYRLL